MTKLGDIAFGLNFLPTDGGEIEVVPSSRVPSDKEEIFGTYQALSEGTAILYWDNSFSWLTQKDLSYTLKISQPAFAAADTSRSIKARYLLNHTNREIKKAKQQFTELSEQETIARKELPILKAELDRLNDLLNRNMDQLSHLASHNQIMSEYLENQQRVVNGLCIRVLEHKLLEQVFSYLLPSPSLGCVCKYWNSIVSNFGPPPLVIAGPAGVGKGTLINLLITKHPSIFGFSVSHTTRSPRPGEVHGVHYNYVTIPEMEAAIQQGKFLEYAQVHTNYYGTSYEAINKIRIAGRICVLDIDIQGVQKIKESGMDCRYIFITPPSIEELERRLRGRATETEEKIQIRLRNANDEMKYGLERGNFDFIVMNQTVEETFQKIVDYLNTCYFAYGVRIVL